MSNFPRVNKNSTISQSTNDNTSSLRLNNRLMDDFDIKNIQKRLANKIGVKGEKTQDKRNRLEQNISANGAKEIKSLRKTNATPINKITSPQKVSLRKQFNSLFEKANFIKSSSKKSKVKALLSYRQKLNQNSSNKQLSSNSGNRSLTLRGIKSRELLKTQKNGKKDRSNKTLQRKKSLGDRIVTPLTKHKTESNGHLKCGDPAVGNNTAYGLFYSPKEIRSRLLNSSNSHLLNGLKTINSNLADSLGKSRYLKKVGKRHPFFDVNSTVFSKKGSTSGRSRIPEGSSQLLNDGSSYGNRKSSKDELSSKRIVDVGGQRILVLSNSREFLDYNELSYCSNSHRSGSIEPVKGEVNPHLLEKMELFKQNLKNAFMKSEAELSGLLEQER